MSSKTEKINKTPENCDLCYDHKPPVKVCNKCNTSVCFKCTHHPYNICKNDVCKNDVCKK
jgi:hypothetical protein